MKTARKGTADKINNRLATHAQFMRTLEDEGWDRDAASKEALRMVEKIDALPAGNATLKD